MRYFDRVLLGFALSAQAVAYYYATPQELVLRLETVPIAVVAVIFPLFTSQATAIRAGILSVTCPSIRPRSSNC